MQISIYFLFFMIYSFIGWLYESAICSAVKQHKLINRGYLWGPYCPIYGAGAVVNLILLKDVKSAILIFVISMVTSGAIEYVTSYAMEKLFHARWWDYSEYPLNFEGCICLYGCLIFGAGNAILIKVVHPYVLHLTDTFSSDAVNICAAFLFAIIALDTIFTTIHMKNFNGKLKYLQDSVNVLVNNSISSIADKKKYIQENLKAIKGKEITINIRNAKKQFKKSELRILCAFPRFRSTKYSVIAEKIKQLITR